MWHSDYAVGWPCAARPRVIAVYRSCAPHSKPMFRAIGTRLLIQAKKGRCRPTDSTGERAGGKPATGDFAKPDCEMAGERPITRPPPNENTATKFPNMLAAVGGG